MLKEALSLKLQQGIKDNIMDFKDILTQQTLERVTEKKTMSLRKRTKRPSNMLTESTKQLKLYNQYPKN